MKSSTVRIPSYDLAHAGSTPNRVAPRILPPNCRRDAWHSGTNEEASAPFLRPFPWRTSVLCNHRDTSEVYAPTQLVFSVQVAKLEATFTELHRR